MSTNEAPKVAAYLRISEDRAGEEWGVQRQGEDARAMAARRGWPAPVEYVDNDLSAAGKVVRAAFERVVADIDAGRINVVIALTLDRFLRTPRDRLRVLELGKDKGLTIALIRGSDMDLSTPAGRLTADILGSVAAHEIELKSDRQRRAARQAAEQGRRIGGRRPFGYERDGVRIREVEADALRRAYDQVLHGVPVGSVARGLNAAGLFTPQDARKWKHGDDCLCPEPGNSSTAEACPERTKLSRWTPQSLRVTLLNPRNCGIRAASRGTGTQKTWEHVSAAVWPPVVSEDLWRAVNAILESSDRRNPARSGARLLTGVGRCGVCGSTVQTGATSLQASTRGYFTYRCRGSNGHIARRGDTIEAYVAAVVVGRLSRPDAAELLLDAERPDLAEMQSRAQTLRVRLDGLAALFSEGVLTAAGVRAESARLRDALTAVEVEMADAGRNPVLEPLVAAENVRAAWDALDVDRQRMVIDLLMDVRILSVGRGRRAFDPDSIAITWKVGTA